MRRIDILGFIFIFLCALFLYRDVFLRGKIVFSSSFLAQFYSPWSTVKFQGWESGIPHKPIGTDQIRFFYPSRTFTNEMIKNGFIPLWNPYIFSGVPHVADYQSAVFYPLNILYFLLPQITAWSILIFIQPILATVFTYLYLRLFSIHKIAAILGAFSFGFSGFMIVWNQENAVVGQAALWLPLVLFGIEGFLKKINKGWYFLAAVCSLTLSFLAGFFQITFYIAVLTFCYGLFRIYQLKYATKIQPTLFTMSAFILAISLSAIQLVPSIEGYLESPRTTSSARYLFDLYLLPITHIVNLLAPDIFGNPGAYNFFGRGFYHETILYIGVIPLVFAIYASFYFRTNKIIYFFLGSALLSLFLALDSPPTKWFYSLPIPLVSTFLPSRIFIITTFSLAVLSAFGLSIWLKKNAQKNETIIGRVFIVFFIILGLALLYGIVSLFFDSGIFQSINSYIIRPGGFPNKTYIMVMIKNVALPFIFLLLGFIFVRSKKSRGFSIGGIVLITLLGQFYFLNKYLVLGFPEFLYPNHTTFSFLQERTRSFERFLTFGQPILGNIATYKHLYSPEGLDPIFSNRYGELLFAAKNNGRLTKDIPRIEVTMSELGEKESLLDNKRRLRLMSLLGVKHLLYYEKKDGLESLEKKFPKDVFLQIWQSGSWHAFLNKNALPRAFFVENVRIEKDPQRIIDLFFSKDFNLSKSVILEEKPESYTLSSGNIENSELKIKIYEPQKVEILAKTSRQRILFLSDNYYPGWKAFVDDAPVRIYRANFAFRAVVVPKGDHAVTFVYDPLSFKTGKIITYISTIIFMGIFLIILN